MRSALIVATFALTILAVPVPEADINSRSAEPMYRANQRRVINSRSAEPVYRANQRRDINFEIRTVRDPRPDGRPKDSRDVEEDAEGEVETRGVNKGHNAREVEEEEDVEFEAHPPAPLYHVNERREAEAEPGYVRGPTKRELEPISLRSAAPEPFTRTAKPGRRSTAF